MIESDSKPLPYANIFTNKNLNKDLRGKSVRNGAITVFAQILRFSLNMGVTIVLARLLVPEDFGLFGMCGSVLVFINLFRDMGFSWATIQREEINHHQVSTLFWINVGMGTIVAIATVLAAPFVARFFDDERITSLMMAMAIPSFLIGFASQHGALLARQMRFAREQTNTLIALAVGFGVAIFSAINGYGYWALVHQQIASSVVTIILFWSSVKWVPGRPRRRTGIREMVKFGMSLLGTGLVDNMSKNADNIIIGATAGPVALGLYSKAYGILTLPLRQINAPIGRVAMPSLSRLQSDPVRFCSFYKKGVGLLAFFGMPIITFSYVAAEEVIWVMLGEQWMETVNLFRILAPAAIVGTFNLACGWLYVPLGKPQRGFYIMLVSAPLTVLAFLIGSQWGAVGVAYSFSIITVLKIVPELYFSTLGSPVKLRDVFASLWKPLTAAILSGAAVWFLKPFWDMVSNHILNASVTFCVLAVLYPATYLLLPGGKEFLLNAKNTVIDAFIKKKKR